MESIIEELRRLVKTRTGKRPMEEDFLQSLAGGCGLAGIPASELIEGCYRSRKKVPEAGTREKKAPLRSLFSLQLMERKTRPGNRLRELNAEIGGATEAPFSLTNSLSAT